MFHNKFTSNNNITLNVQYILIKFDFENNMTYNVIPDYIFYFYFHERLFFFSWFIWHMNLLALLKLYIHSLLRNWTKIAVTFERKQIWFDRQHSKIVSSCKNVSSMYLIFQCLCYIVKYILDCCYADNSTMTKYAGNNKLTIWICKIKLNSSSTVFVSLIQFQISSNILQLFYDSVVSSVWKYCVSVWGGNSSKKDMDIITSTITKASKLLENPQETFIDNYEKVVIRKMQSIRKDDSHPLFLIFENLVNARSGRMRLPYASTNRHRLSFVPQAVKFHNRDFSRWYPRTDDHTIFFCIFVLIYVWHVANELPCRDIIKLYLLTYLLTYKSLNLAPSVYSIQYS